MWSLVVEDHPANARALKRRLCKACPDVRVAPDGPSAVEMLERPSLYAASIDVRLPGLDGFSVATVLRELHPRAYAAIVTGFADTKAVDRAYAMGIEIVTKDDLDAAAELNALKAAAFNNPREPKLAVLSAFSALWGFSEKEAMVLTQYVGGCEIKSLSAVFGIEDSTIETMVSAIVRKSRRRSLQEIRSLLVTAAGQNAYA